MNLFDVKGSSMSSYSTFNGLGITDFFKSAKIVSLHTFVCIGIRFVNYQIIVFPMGLADGGTLSLSISLDCFSGLTDF